MKLNTNLKKVEVRVAMVNFNPKTPDSSSQKDMNIDVKSSSRQPSIKQTKETEINNQFIKALTEVLESREPKKGIFERVFSWWSGPKYIVVDQEGQVSTSTKSDKRALPVQISKLMQNVLASKDFTETKKDEALYKFGIILNNYKDKKPGILSSLWNRDAVSKKQAQRAAEVETLFEQVIATPPVSTPTVLKGEKHGVIPSLSKINEETEQELEAETDIEDVSDDEIDTEVAGSDGLPEEMVDDDVVGRETPNQAAKLETESVIDPKKLAEKEKEDALIKFRYILKVNDLLPKKILGDDEKSLGYLNQIIGSKSAQRLFDKITKPKAGEEIQIEVSDYYSFDHVEKELKQAIAKIKSAEEKLKKMN